MDNHHYVYGLIDPRTGTIFYIGKGSGTRYNSHLFTTERLSNPRKFKVIEEILECGLSYDVKIFVQDLTNEEAYNEEERLIKQYGRINYEDSGILTNIHCGGARPPSGKGRKRGEMPDEQRKKVSKGLRLYFERKRSLSDKEILEIKLQEKKELLYAGKQRNIAFHTGRPLPVSAREKLSDFNRGKVLSEEHKGKIKLANIGKTLSPETKLLLSVAHTGKKASDETRKVLSESHKGEKNHFYGKTHTAETKVKMSMAWQQRRERGTR